MIDIGSFRKPAAGLLEKSNRKEERAVEEEVVGCVVGGGIKVNTVFAVRSLKFFSLGDGITSPLEGSDIDS